MGDKSQNGKVRTFADISKLQKTETYYGQLKVKLLEKSVRFG